MYKPALFFALSVFACYACDKETTVDPPATPVAPHIISFDPDSGYEGTEVHITGENFNPDLAFTQVYFGDFQASVASAGKNELVVFVPFKNLSSEVKIRVTSNALTDTSLSAFKIISPWKEENIFPAEMNYDPSGFTLNGIEYILLVNNSLQVPQVTLWKFDPVADTWTAIGAFPGTYRQKFVTFVVNNKAYAGLGLDLTTVPNGRFRDLWEYDPGKNEWTMMKEYPGSITDLMMGFQSGFRGYITSSESELNELWQFDPANNAWNRKNDYSLKLDPGLEMDGISYFKCNDFIYTYNPENDAFEQVSAEKSFGINGFGLKGYLYYFDYTDFHINRFNVATKLWDSKYIYFPYENSRFNFSLNGMGYSMILDNLKKIIQFDPGYW